MTSPNTPNDLVTEMIDRLRILQGSGEYVPLGRRVIAGTGLAGGGSLTGDVTVSLDEATARLVQLVDDLGDTEALATDAEVAAAIAPLVPRAKVAPRIVYRDFSVMEPPASQVTAPALRVDEACQAARLSVSVGTPGTRAVVVSVNGQSLTVAAGGSQGTRTLALSLRAGDTLRLTVSSTDAAGIVASVRLEESGVLP